MAYIKTEQDKERNRQRKAEWYQENRTTQHARIRANKRKNSAWLREYKSTLKCSRCPENHPATLDFHHRDPTMKEETIGKAVERGWGKVRILAEVAKCDVLCSNCHRKEHRPNG